MAIPIPLNAEEITKRLSGLWGVACPVSVSEQLVEGFHAGAFDSESSAVFSTGQRVAQVKGWLNIGSFYENKSY